MVLRHKAESANVLPPVWRLGYVSAEMSFETDATSCKAGSFFCTRECTQLEARCRCSVVLYSAGTCCGGRSLQKDPSDW